MRGKLPRSFKIGLADPLNGSPTQTNCYLYDAALTLIATVGDNRKNLAYEIVQGIVLAQTSAGKLPFSAYDIDSTATSTDFPNQTMAIVAYSLGYYLELYQGTPDYCHIAQVLKNILQFLQRERDWLYTGGLIYNGSNSIGHDRGFRTESNLLAYFAFKQAAKVFQNTYYTDAANELKDAIIDKLWSSDKLNYGLSDTGVLDSTNALEVHAYGSLFFSEIEDNDKALICLNKCEAFSTIDAVNGARGYTAFISSPDHVWFEMSYAVALAYLRAGNHVKYGQIINELNRYVNGDGGFAGALLKTFEDEALIGYEAIGSTSWSIIANVLKGSAFKIRTSIGALVGCPLPYFNTELTTVFTKDDCTGGDTPSTYSYVVPAGRYISYVDQPTADSFATNEATSFGQAYVDMYGSCIPITSVGNDEQSGDFTTQGCEVGYHGSVWTVTVPANTYYAATLTDANNLALAWIVAHGQAEANTHGTCLIDSVDNYIYIVIEEPMGGSVNIRAYATLPVNTDISIAWHLHDSTTADLGAQTNLHIYTGDTSSPIFSILDPATFPSYYGVVTSITPPSYMGMGYTT